MASKIGDSANYVDNTLSILGLSNLVAFYTNMKVSCPKKSPHNLREVFNDAKPKHDVKGFYYNEKFFNFPATSLCFSAPSE